MISFKNFIIKSGVIICIAILTISLSCCGKVSSGENNNKVQTTISDSNLDRKNNLKDTLIDSLSYTSILNPIQQDTEQYHYFGDIRVEKTKFIKKRLSGGIYISEKIDGYRYNEPWPYILNKVKVRTNKIEEVRYYDSTRTHLSKVIDLDSINPYLPKYTNLINAYPSFEYYEAPPDSLLAWYRNQKPDKYLTFYSSGHATKSGFALPRYSLVGIKDGYIQSWESTLVVIDRDGKILTTIREPNQIGIAYISDDGSIIAYEYGDYLDNPHDDRPLGEVRIREARTKKLIYKTTPEVGIRYGLGSYDEIGKFIGIGRTQIHSDPPDNPPDKIKVEIVNMMNRTRYIRDFTWEKYEHAKRKYLFTGYLLHHYEFKKSKF